MAELLNDDVGDSRGWFLASPSLTPPLSPLAFRSSVDRATWLAGCVSVLSIKAHKKNRVKNTKSDAENTFPGKTK